MLSPGICRVGIVVLDFGVLESCPVVAFGGGTEWAQSAVIVACWVSFCGLPIWRHGPSLGFSCAFPCVLTCAPERVCSGLRCWECDVREGSAGGTRCCTIFFGSCSPLQGSSSSITTTVDVVVGVFWVVVVVPGGCVKVEFEVELTLARKVVAFSTYFEGLAVNVVVGCGRGRAVGPTGGLAECAVLGGGV